MSLFLMSFVGLNYQFKRSAIEHVDTWGDKPFFFQRVSFVGDANLCASIDTQGLTGLKGCSIPSDRRSQRRDL